MNRCEATVHQIRVAASSGRGARSFEQAEAWKALKPPPDSGTLGTWCQRKEPHAGSCTRLGCGRAPLVVRALTEDAFPTNEDFCYVECSISTRSRVNLAPGVFLGLPNLVS